MSEPVEATTTRLLGLAVHAASLRQQAAATNLAQAATPGWQAWRVEFEAGLAQARQDLLASGRVRPSSLDGVQPRLVRTEAPPAALDGELAALAGHMVHAQVLLQGLSRHLALLSQAAADGRR